MFTLSCFLTKCVILSLYVVRYIKEKVQDVEVEMFLGIVFICSMEYWVCFCVASLIGEVVSKETKWSYEKVEIAACVVGRERDCVRRSLVKVWFAVGGNKLWSHREFCVSGGFGERRALSPLKWPRGEMRARRREWNKASHSQFWYSQFWGWHKENSLDTKVGSKAILEQNMEPPKNSCVWRIECI